MPKVIPDRGAGAAPKKPKPKPAPVYVNPLRLAKQVQRWRTDQGVDFGAQLGSIVVAMGNMRVTRSVTNSGWPGGGCVQYVLLEGPHKGEEVYVAEFIDPLVQPGHYYKTGAPVARFNHDHTSGVGIETGWIRPGTNEPCSTDTSGNPTLGGLAFARWLRQLGCRTRDNPGKGPTTCPCGHH